MVVTLGPGKFYGSSLPRPRIYTDVKLNEERVDPPVPVMDPLMSWAQEAHWSMGGLGVKRHRLQGKIEGNIQRLRAQKESKDLKPAKISVSHPDNAGNETPSPPPAPVANKRKRVLALIDGEEEEDDEREYKRGTVRKLGDDFERVARESGMSSGGDAVAARTRSKRNESNVVEETVNKEKIKKGKKKLVKGMKGGEEGGAAVAASGTGTRSSPRLAKRGGSR